MLSTSKLTEKLFDIDIDVALLKKPLLENPWESGKPKLVDLRGANADVSV